MTLITLLGFLAGTLTTISFLPQLLKTWRSKSAKDMSLPMLISFCAGVFLWLVYGFLIQAPPIILANGITLILALMILGLKLHYDKT
jgi:MtN3 and saliva related transmembrane protein